MQKFIKGSKDDNMPPMPVIIGMTATPKRFKDLVTGIKCTKRDVDVPVENVRDSGLLKEKIIISYPESDAIHKDMAVLQAATDEWKEKCDGWFKYCQKMNEFAVKPVFLVQVQNKVSNTDLNDCVKKIEERVGYKFKEGEVVNAFGEHDDLPISDMTIRYVEPSKIAEEESIKIVFFKDSLSTGWDCPRAETMMSFRTVSDETNIAQLLGRMVRTPLGHKVENDSLNDVHLFLPNFDAVTVQKVVQELQDSEGGKITEVDEEVVGSPKYEILSARPQIRRPKIHREPEGQQNLFSTLQPKTESYLEAKLEVESMEATPQYIDNKTKEVIVEAKMSESVEEGYEYADGINRLEIVEWINSLQLKTCKLNARPIKNGYLKPLCKIIRVLNESGMNTKALSEVQDEVVEMIRSYTEKLKADNEFQSKVDKLMEFKMHSQVVDIFGESVNKQLAFDLFSTTDTDIQRQFQKAEKELCDEGFGKAYLKKYYDTNSDYPQELDVIIFAKECIQKLDSYADKKYHLFKDEYLQKIDSYPEYKEQFKSIVCSADSINWLYLELRMDDIKYPLHQDVGSCTDHLFVNNEGTAKIKLDSDLERATLDEERKSPDFVCWLRNPKNADWALSIPYKMNGENKLMYPDFLIVRKDGNGGYKLDILEPHSESLADNLPKAQGLAKYADESYNLNLNRLSRIQLIRWKDNVPGTKLVRLDFKQSKIREEVMTKAGNDEDLDRIFEKYGE